ncbi:hypothetical protein Dimus_009441 [Dionaea muscipula]
MVPEAQRPASPLEDEADLHRQPWRGGEDDETEQLVGDRNGPAHHPAAPPDELFDIPTTVDPSYIISLIRNLLPCNERRDHVQGRNHGDDPSGSSKTDFTEDDPAAPSRNGGLNLISGGILSMGTENIDSQKSPRSAASGDESYASPPERSAREKVWEESGCVLWDLAANKSHAEFMVENLVLEVLLANLTTSDSVRITEINVGIIGNLACHEVPMKKIISTNGLVEAIVDQVFLDDTPCLSETCRLVSLGLGSPECITWVMALQSEHVLSRILWIAENTLNPHLIEKISGLLSVIIEYQQEVVSTLLPTLKNLGLLRILVNLLSFEMSKLMTERLPERYPALDSILHAVEALSTNDDFSQEISSNRELFQMAVELVKLPDKIEVASPCITAAVLIANILTDSPDLALEMSKDSLVLQCLFDLFPLASDDFEARNAIWSIVARLSNQIQANDMSSSNIAPYVLALVSKSDLIEDDLLDYQVETSSQKHGNSPDGAAKLNFRSIALKTISSLLSQWIRVKDHDGNSFTENHVADGSCHIRLSGSVLTWPVLDHTMKNSLFKPEEKLPKNSHHFNLEMV